MCRCKLHVKAPPSPHVSLSAHGTDTFMCCISTSNCPTPKPWLRSWSRWLVSSVEDAKRALPPSAHDKNSSCGRGQDTATTSSETRQPHCGRQGPLAFAGTACGPYPTAFASPAGHRGLCRWRLPLPVAWGKLRTMCVFSCCSSASVKSDVQRASLRMRLYSDSTAAESVSQPPMLSYLHAAKVYATLYAGRS